MTIVSSTFHGRNRAVGNEINSFCFYQIYFQDKMKTKRITEIILHFVSFFLSVYLVYIWTTNLEKLIKVEEKVFKNN